MPSRPPERVEPPAGGYTASEDVRLEVSILASEAGPPSSGAVLFAGLPAHDLAAWRRLLHPLPLEAVDMPGEAAVQARLRRGGVALVITGHAAPSCVPVLLADAAAQAVPVLLLPGPAAPPAAPGAPLGMLLRLLLDLPPP